METTTAKEKSTANGQKAAVNPSHIMQVGLGFWASKVLLAAVRLDLFTLLAAKPLPAADIQRRLKLHDRGLYDFLDTLVALGFLTRTGSGAEALYGDAEDTALFLDRNKPSYMGGMFEMANNRLYRFWGNLEEGLMTGKPQNEMKDGDKPLFEALYADPARLQEFVRAMAGIQAGNFMAFSKKFDFSGYKTLCDIGGAGGDLSIRVAGSQPHMKCISLDLPVVAPIAQKRVADAGLSDRIDVRSGDFFKEPFPRADVITMANVLHDWGTTERKMLIRQAYDALPAGGALVVIEGIIDDDRRENAFALMMSLNMLIETDAGANFTHADFDAWAREIGFSKTSLMPLTGPHSAAIAIK